MQANSLPCIRDCSPGRRFEHKLHAAQLSPAELSAVAAFLVLNVEEFAPLMRYDLPLKVGRAPSQLARHLLAEL